MAQGETPITIVGNVVAAPELRYTKGGVAVANFRVASTPRVYDSQSKQWADGEPLFLTCHAWRDMAENAMDTLTKGMRVIVSGKLRQRTWQTDQGEKRTFFEVDAEDVGPSLRFATAQVTRNHRGGGGGGSSDGCQWGGGPRSGPYAKNPDPAGGEQPPF